MPRKKPLSGQVVVVGGGSFGLGRAIAERAKERGASVVIGARTHEALEGAGVDLALETDVPTVPRSSSSWRRPSSASAGSIRMSPTPWSPSMRRPTGSRRTSSAGSSTSTSSAGSTGTGLLSHTCVPRARQKVGLQPQPVPPIYEPEPFADAVLHCCERPIRELPVGWGAQKLLWGQKLSPRTGDRILLRNGWRGQHTEQLKPTDSPDSLFEPLPGDPGARGRFEERSRDSTAWTWLRLHRGLIGTGLGLGTIGLLAGLQGRIPPLNGKS